MKKKELGNLIDLCYRMAGNKETVILADRLKDIGFEFATRAGISISINDMTIPPQKARSAGRGAEAGRRDPEAVQQGLITDGERYNKVVDIWAEVQDRIGGEVLKGLSTQVFGKDKDGAEVSGPSFNPIFIMADSGARGSAQQIRQLAGMRGLMAKPSGEIIETPITANFREGLTVLQYFISTHGARKGLADTALKTANSGYLTRRLVDVAQDSIITEVRLRHPRRHRDDAAGRGRRDHRGVGRPHAGPRGAGRHPRPVHQRGAGQGQREDRRGTRSQAIEEAGSGAGQDPLGADLPVAPGRVRPVLRPRPGRGHMVNIGEAVGVIAAQSIGEPGTQLTMRTFHIGGTASRRAEQTTLEAATRASCAAQPQHRAKSRTASLVVMNRHGEVAVVELVAGEAGHRERERERYPLVYGARLRKGEGDRGQGRRIARRVGSVHHADPHRGGGQVKFGDIIEGVTMEEQVDERTGLLAR